MSSRFFLGALLAVVGYSARIRLRSQDSRRAGIAERRVAASGSRSTVQGRSHNRTRALNTTFQHNVRWHGPTDKATSQQDSEDTGFLGSTSRRKQMIVVVSSASWHAVMAVIVLSAVALKCYAGEMESSVPIVHAPSGAAAGAGSSGFLDDGALSPGKITIVKMFVFVSAFVTTMDCTVFIPASTEVAKNVGGGILLSGLLLGAYGIGGIFGSFIIRSLTHQSIKASFLFVCICMFIGNSTSLLSFLYPKELPWDLLVFLSRVFAGMELGLDYTNQVLIMEILNPTKENSVRVALFSYVRLFQYAGAALGPAIAAFFTLVGSKWNLPDGAPTVTIMWCFSIVFVLFTIICFPRVELPLKSRNDMIASYNPDELPLGKLSKAWASFLAFNLITFLRHGMRLAVEAGSLIVFTQTFLFSHGAAACLTSAVMMISIPGNFCIGRMIEAKRIFIESEEASSYLEQSMLAVQLLGSMFLFSFAGGGRIGFVLFICGSALFYGVNAAISNLLQVSYLDAKINGHPILKQDRLIIINTIAIQLGMAAGPIASRALNAWCVGQDTLAFFVVSNLFWQYLCARVLKAPGLTKRANSVEERPEDYCCCRSLK